MANSIEFLLERIRVNCKWYFGHDVQVITYYYGPDANWCVIVYPAHLTRALAFQGSSDKDIHLYSDSKGSLYEALEKARWEIDLRIGDIFKTSEGDKHPVIKVYEEGCGCQQRPASPTLAEYEAKIQDLGTRLQELENKSLPGTAQVNDGDTTGRPDSPSAEASSAHEIWPMLQKIERRLEAIEQRMHHCPAENTTTTTPDDGENIHGVTAAVDTQDTPSDTAADPAEQLNTPIPRGAQSPRSWFERMTEIRESNMGEIPEPETILRSSSRASTRSSHHDEHFEDFNSVTDMTPSASTTDRSITPRAGRDAAAELNRELLREEINRALAGAMLNLAGILGRVDDSGV